MIETRDDRFLMRPELPQYGEHLTCCRVGLPKPAGIFKVLALLFCLSLPVLISIPVSKKHFPTNQPIQSVIVITVMMAMSGLGYWMFTGKSRVNRNEALFVFDGGIHLNEQVSYTVPGGSWLEFCTGLRQVSLPWRVLKGFELTETEFRNEPHFEASFTIPDGRTMHLSTADGHESIVAIRAIQKKLTT